MDRITGLQIFARMVETGSLSKVPRDLSPSQPAVTKHVACIETKLGARLLNRNTRRVSLIEVETFYDTIARALTRRSKPHVKLH